MDRWKFFAITHTDHLLCNPTSSAKLDEMIGLLDLPNGGSVLDIASGKAEFLFRLVARYGVNGIGVDLSPYCVREATERAEREGCTRLRFIEQAGADFRADPASFDFVSCLGASWTFGDHRGTLTQLREWVRPGGLILVGEPFWRRPLTAEELAASDFQPTDFLTHAGNVAVGEDLGLLPLYTMVSNGDDWDRYEGLQWRAAERYAQQHPDDPDVPELLERQRRSRNQYLNFQRDALGWALYLFQRPPA